MRRYVFRLAILGLAVLGPGVVRGDDQQIAQQIVQKLQAEKQAGTLQGFSIDLSVEEGTVWLSGRVSNEQQQAKALDIARRIPGVKQVVNDLTVTPPATGHGASAKNVFSSMSKAISNPFRRTEVEEASAVQPASAEEEGLPTSSRRVIGSGVESKPLSPWQTCRHRWLPRHRPLLPRSSRWHISTLCPSMPARRTRFRGRLLRPTMKPSRGTMPRRACRFRPHPWMPA
jgi:hypothetical protein